MKNLKTNNILLTKHYTMCSITQTKYKNLKTNKMKQTAVEYLVSKLNPYGLSESQTEYLEQAKELEQKQRDKFAIGFAKWCDNNQYDRLIDGRWYSSLNVNNRNKSISSKELLEIYKKENL